MIKKLTALILLCLMILPVHVYTEDNYVTQNLDEILTEEEIEHDFSNYEETDDQIPIYLFHGRGCTYCKNFLNFLNDNIDEYGKYFKVVGYEVWYNTENADLMDEVADFLGESSNGVPFIVIGDQVFTGYSSSWDEQILSAITNLYNSEDRYDVFEEMAKGDTSISNGTVILWNLFFVVVATIIIVLTNHFENKKLTVRIDELEEKLTHKQNKSSKKETAKENLE